jgi:hypothetical protein
MVVVARMRIIFRFLKPCIILFCGLTVVAQAQADRYAEVIPILDRSVRALVLVEGKLTTDSNETIRIIPNFGKNKAFGDYLYNGKVYRKLSPYERNQFDAMPKIKLDRGKLYFDGIEIKTTPKKVLWIKSARYWNGGVIIFGLASKGTRFGKLGVGFINLQSYECSFMLFSAKGSTSGTSPEFLVPVTINPSNEDLLFDVDIPKKISMNSRFDCTIKLTNVSEKDILLPDDLYDGLGINRVTIQREDGPPDGPLSVFSMLSDRGFFSAQAAEGTPPSNKHPGGPLPDVSRWDFFFTARFPEGYPLNKKSPDLAEKPGSTYSPLRPSETRSTTVTFDPKLLFLRHRERMRTAVFFWEGFLVPGDRDKLSRFACKKTMEVDDSPPFVINIKAEHAGLAFDVRVPNEGNSGDIFDVVVTLTNVSDKPVLVPDSLLTGLRIIDLENITERKRGFIEHYATDIKNEFILRHCYPKLLVAPKTKSTPLMPYETRESILTNYPENPLFFFYSKGDHRLLFTWDDCLDPDDQSTRTQFAIEKQVTHVRPRNGWPRQPQ